jgi:hypothetical protein
MSDSRLMQITISPSELVNIEKILPTDEVKTRAQFGVSLEIRPGDYISNGRLA